MVVFYDVLPFALATAIGFAGALYGFRAFRLSIARQDGTLVIRNLLRTYRITLPSVLTAAFEPSRPAMPRRLTVVTADGDTFVATGVSKWASLLTDEEINAKPAHRADALVASFFAHST
ncbi:MAG: hypothetical protein ABR593_08910 [Candidatus Limnocylindria bacterium]